jgi:hypothetical protein
MKHFWQIEEGREQAFTIEMRDCQRSFYMDNRYYGKVQRCMERKGWVPK